LTSGVVWLRSGGLSVPPNICICAEIGKTWIGHLHRNRTRPNPCPSCVLPFRQMALSPGSQHQFPKRFICVRIRSYIIIVRTGVKVTREWSRFQAIARKSYDKCRTDRNRNAFYPRQDRRFVIVCLRRWSDLFDDCSLFWTYSISKTKRWLTYVCKIKRGDFPILMKRQKSNRYLW
jgi:hypothetical protein